MPVHNGQLKEKDRTKLQMHYCYLVQELDGGFLVNELFSKNVLTMEDKEDIDSQSTRKDRTEKLLKLIYHSGPGGAFELFLQVLCHHYPHVYEKLMIPDELQECTTDPEATPQIVSELGTRRASALTDHKDTGSLQQGQQTEVRTVDRRSSAASIGSSLGQWQQTEVKTVGRRLSTDSPGSSLEQRQQTEVTTVDKKSSTASVSSFAQKQHDALEQQKHTKVKNFHERNGACSRSISRSMDESLFIPVKEFKMDNLPEPFRQDNLLSYIHILARLTVLVVTQYTSPYRPEGFPSHNKRGQITKRFSSGRVWRVARKIGKKHDGKVCPCPDCTKSCKPKKQWGAFIVVVAKSNVFDNEECLRTSCVLFYDDKDGDSKGKTTCPALRGVSVLRSDMSKDYCELLCVTHSHDVSETVEKLCKRNKKLSAALQDTCHMRAHKEKLAVVVSHPMALPKRISVGHGWRGILT